MYNAVDKQRWDRTAVLQQTVQTAREEGRLEERAKAEGEKRHTAQVLHGMGMPVADIARALAISVEQVQQWV